MQEKQKKWILRIALYLIGIMVLALGITLNTKTNLGRIAHHLHAVRRGTDLRL